MYKTILRGLGLVVLSSLVVGCSDFLSKDPDDRTQINNLEVAKELNISGYNNFSYFNLFELRSDNTSDKSDLLWEPPLYKDIYSYSESVRSTYQDSPQGFWRNSYDAIAAVNQVLSDLDRIGAKGEEADATRGEAYICRAYAMYMLAQMFTVPYDPATAAQEKGLPYPTEPETQLIKEYKRGTLQELYDSIAKDFEAGYALIGDSYKAPKFHFTRQATAAFGTRLYRTVHNWDRVLELGDACLGSNPGMYIRHINDASTNYQGTYAERQEVWGHETENCNFLINVCMTNWGRYFADRYGVSIDLFSFFGLADESKGHTFLGENVRPMFTHYGGDNYPNVPKFQKHFEVTNKQEGTGFVYAQMVLLSGDEVLFNMAEAYAMKGQFDRTEQLLQLFVSHYMRGYNPSNPTFQVTGEKIRDFYQDKVGKMAPDPIHGIEINSFNPSFSYSPEQEMYLRACIDLKRLAFIHEGMRWMDNRQYRMDIVHNFFEKGNESYVVLRGTDKRYAYQLPENVLEFLEKNEGYEKPLEVVTK